MWYYPNGSKTAPHISDDFGPGMLNGVPRFHQGDDVTGFTWNRAVSDGTVVFVGYEAGNWGGGLQVWVNHGDGIQSRYKHHETGTVRVKVGDRVAAGQILGQQGDTGLASGVHLHYEIRVNGTPVRPSAFISIRLRGGGTSGGGVTSPIQQEESSMRGKSSNTGKWYIIPDDGGPITVIPADESERAGAYKASFHGVRFPVLTPKQLNYLIDDNAAARKASLEAQAAALGVTETQARLDRLSVEIAEIKAAEPDVDVDEEAIAALVREDIAKDLAEIVAADSAATIATLRSTIPADTLALLAQQLVGP